MAETQLVTRLDSRPPRIAYIHSFATLPAVFDRLTQKYLPDASTSHVVDSSFYTAEFERGELSEGEEALLLRYVQGAADADADVAVVTCSFLGSYVDKLRGRATIPWIRVDEAMAREALRTGERVGVIATAESSLRASTELLHRLASEYRGSHEVKGRLCEGAFEALTAGERQRHDDAVGHELQDLEGSVDVIVLAQASMAAVAEELELQVPVLSSPELCVRSLRGLLGDTQRNSTHTSEGA